MVSLIRFLLHIRSAAGPKVRKIPRQKRRYAPGDRASAKHSIDPGRGPAGVLRLCTDTSSPAALNTCVVAAAAAWFAVCRVDPIPATLVTAPVRRSVDYQAVNAHATAFHEQFLQTLTSSWEAIPANNGEKWDVLAVTDHGHIGPNQFDRGHGFQSPSRQPHSSSGIRPAI